MEPAKKSTVINQIIIAVVIALLVGSSSPWWWTELRSLLIVSEDTVSESTIVLRLDPTLTGHLWVSTGGGTQFLDTGLYAYRVGATHIDDLPPAGKSSSIFSFDLNEVQGKELSKAVLHIHPSNVVGNPFRDLSPLMVREVSIGDLSQVLQSDPRQTIARLTSIPAKPLIITDAVNAAIRNGMKYFQISVQFDGLFLTGIDAELRVQDSYLQWDTGMEIRVVNAP